MFVKCGVLNRKTVDLYLWSYSKLVMLKCIHNDIALETQRNVHVRMCILYFIDTVML